jgi:hypothetical protein
MKPPVLSWRDDETFTEFCVRACGTESKKAVADALRQVETMMDNHRPWRRGLVEFRGGRDMLLAKLRLIEDQETNE